MYGTETKARMRRLRVLIDCLSPNYRKLPPCTDGLGRFSFLHFNLTVPLGGPVPESSHRPVRAGPAAAGPESRSRSGGARCAYAHTGDTLQLLEQA